MFQYVQVFKLVYSNQPILMFSLTFPGSGPEYCRVHAAVRLVLLAQCCTLLFWWLPARQGFWNQVQGKMWHVVLYQKEEMLNLFVLVTIVSDPLCPFLIGWGPSSFPSLSVSGRWIHLDQSSGNCNMGINENHPFSFPPLNPTKVIFATGAMVNRFWLCEVGRFVFG